MKNVKVVFKNGNREEFIVDSYYIADNDICLYLINNNRKTGMINLCEVRYFNVEKIEPKSTLHYEGGNYEIR
ncbi:hypothetical protein [uncultured Anaerococcus sp.]|uniref:hypothetical protein n=1 Tax=uncultured Anaerococcus sp. TaxID=293428 RepID=UPI0028059426|nr:hypothetical protein [uncultured Anaerococcus sp.]